MMRASESVIDDGAKLMKNIILLNGPSSAGKSTLSKELKKQLGDADMEAVIISIDDYMVTDPKLKMQKKYFSVFDDRKCLKS